MDAHSGRAAFLAAFKRASREYTRGTLPQPRATAKPQRARCLAGAVGRIAAFGCLLLVAMGAQQRSANYVVETADPNFARVVSQAAEQYRRELAVAWIGKAMPDWSQPCVMTVQAGPQLGAGGATTFQFQDGEVFGWRMTIQGSQQRILDSVLPHEITHMVFASYFRQPLPRWADEGGATTVEHVSERNKYRQLLDRFLRTGRGIAFNEMFAMAEYPQDIMPLYAEGYSLAEYLIQSGGRRKYVEFLADGLKTADWASAVHRGYGFTDLGTLQDTWLNWVKQGAPLMAPPAPRASGTGVASGTRANGTGVVSGTRTGGTPVAQVADGRRPRPQPNLIYRIREPEPVPAATTAYAERPTPVPLAETAPSGTPATQTTADPSDRPAPAPLRWVEPSPQN